MAIIVRDPQVTDYIVERPISSEAEVAEVRRLYEEGHLILLSGARFDLDFEFLNSVSLDVGGPPEILHKVKKFGGERFLALSPSSTAPVDAFIFKNIFGSDAGRLSYFQEQVKSGNVQSDALYAKLFPRYVTTRAVHTWRFTETMYENLHWDVFKIPEPFHQVRIFTNIAASRRLWRVSHRSYEFADNIYEQRNLARFAGAIGDDLLRYLNRKVLLGETPCFDRQAKHHIAFEQGDVWIGETRLLAHQIYHGERAFAAMYFSNPETMDRPELAFEARIQQLHERHAAPGGAPLQRALEGAELGMQ